MAVDKGGHFLGEYLMICFSILFHGFTLNVPLIFSYSIDDSSINTQVFDFWGEIKDKLDMAQWDIERMYKTQ